MVSLTFLDVKYNKKYKGRVEKLYYEAFPKYERAPIWILKLLAKKNKARFYSIIDNGKFVGLSYNVFYKDIVFVFYFAIDGALRGQGYGSRVLEAIKEKYSNNRIILNIEEIDKNSKNYEQRVKRKKFYQKNGFKDLGYTVKEGEIVYEMLCYNKDDKIVSSEEYKELMNYYLGKMLYKYVYEKISK